MHQERDYPGRVSGTNLQNPDFVAVAQAYGLAGVAVSHADAFPAAFEEVKNAPYGGIIELDINVQAISPTKQLSDL